MSVIEESFDSLDAPVERIAGADIPMPYAANLERMALPQVCILRFSFVFLVITFYIVSDLLVIWKFMTSPLNYIQRLIYFSVASMMLVSQDSQEVSKKIYLDHMIVYSTKLANKKVW